MDEAFVLYVIVVLITAGPYILSFFFHISTAVV